MIDTQQEAVLSWQYITASVNYINLYQGNALVLAESLEVVRQTANAILAALELPMQNWQENGDRVRGAERNTNAGGGVMDTVLRILKAAGG